MKFWADGVNGDRGVRAYSRGLGEAPAGSRGRAPGQGSGEAESIFSFLMPQTGRNLAHLEGFLCSFFKSDTKPPFL